MPFVPTQKQVDSLYLLLTQFVRENNKIRAIRFIGCIPTRECVIEVVCIEEEDRFIIYSNGKIEQR